MLHFNPHHRSLLQEVLLSPFYRQGSRGSGSSEWPRSASLPLSAQSAPMRACARCLGSLGLTFRSGTDCAGERTGAELLQKGLREPPAGKAEEKGIPGAGAACGKAPGSERVQRGACVICLILVSKRLSSGGRCSYEGRRGKLIKSFECQSKR